MSGTSLDGLDLCLAKFTCQESGEWQYEIEKSFCFPYTSEERQKLQSAGKLSGRDLLMLHKWFGVFQAEKINAFLQGFDKPDCIALHGHTVFHEPEFGLNFQLGDGNVVAAKTKIPCIYDFRSMDVALGGQGAPLVPMGDKLLFAEFDACLNLGGFSNISFLRNGKSVAYDICPLNIVFNQLSALLNLPFDNMGNLAASGEINQTVFENLNSLPYYSRKGSKSLSEEWLNTAYWTILNEEPKIENRMRTASEHAAIQIAQEINNNRLIDVLASGGGIYNAFFINRLKHYAPKLQLLQSDKNLIDFKEALIFAFLGALRYLNMTNILAEYTGARADSCSGIIAVNPISKW